MDDQPAQHHSHLFTVRLWQENLGDGHQEWRGKVKYLLSNEERLFRGCDEIGALMLSLLPHFMEESQSMRRKQ